MQQGTVYSETVIHSAPARWAAEAPYQIAVVDLQDGGRRLVRVLGERVKIGDLVRQIDGDSFEVKQ